MTEIEIITRLDVFTCMNIIYTNKTRAKVGPEICMSNDGIWRHRTWSTLVQVMVRCLLAPNHYLNKC